MFASVGLQESLTVSQVIGMIIGVLSDLGVLVILQGFIILMVAMAALMAIYRMRG
jgi:hypothetical protein